MISELTLFVFNFSWLSNKVAFEAAAKIWNISIIFNYIYIIITIIYTYILVIINLKKLYL